MDRRFLKVLGYALLVVVLAWLALLGQIVFFDTQTPVERADAAVVLGAVVWGNEPSPVFRERINHGIALYKDRAVRKLVLTGGAGEGMRYAESEIATEYAVSQGVPERDILVEVESHTTLGNLREIQPLLAEHDLDSLLIVSDPLHLCRALKMAEDLGLEAFPSATPTTRYRSLESQLPFLLRESVLYIAYLLGFEPREGG